MPQTMDMITAQDDRLHAPGPEKEWNESYWFAFYDPDQKIGVMNRAGLLVNKEPAGEVFGEITLGGKKITLKGLGYRDHSAGERDWTALGRWNWIEAQFGASFSFNAVRMILGEGKEKWGGFVFNQGKMMRIRLTECEVETDAGGTAQRRGRFTFRDEEGHTYQVQGEVLDICIDKSDIIG